MRVDVNVYVVMWQKTGSAIGGWGKRWRLQSDSVFNRDVPRTRVVRLHSTIILTAYIQLTARFV